MVITIIKRTRTRFNLLALGSDPAADLFPQTVGQGQFSLALGRCGDREAVDNIAQVIGGFLNGDRASTHRDLELGQVGLVTANGNAGVGTASEGVGTPTSHKVLGRAVSLGVLSQFVVVVGQLTKENLHCLLVRELLKGCGTGVGGVSDQDRGVVDGHHRGVVAKIIHVD